MRNICLLLAALTQPLPALAADKADAAKPVETLARTAKWNMNYADKACYLYGQFGSDDDQVILRFTAILPDSTPRMALFGKRFGWLRGGFIPASIYYLPLAEKRPEMRVSSGDTATSAGKLKGVFIDEVRLDNKWFFGSGLNSLPSVSSQAEAAVTGLRVEIEGMRHFELKLEAMDMVMAAMRKCTDNLVQSWGFDPAELATRQSRATPAGQPANWARTDDYPLGMLNRAQSAVVSFRANVDATGKVTDCVVQQATMPPEIGIRTCNLIMKRASFNPSRDKNGNPVPDFYVSRVHWIIPGR